MKKLEGSVALITGSSSGIGEAAARSLAKRKAHVILTARRKDRLDALAEEIRAMRNGAEAFVIAGDLNAPGEVERIARESLAWKGRVDILVNNAGMGKTRLLETLDPETEILPQIHLDLIVPILLTRAMLPAMLERRSGCIINIDSVNGLVAFPAFSIYSAAKFGLRGFNDVLRRELRGRGIDVCLICPGVVRTEFTEHSTRIRGWEDSIIKRITLPAEALGECIADVACHPRRCVVIPWFYGPLVFLARPIPALTDALMDLVYSRSVRKRTAGLKNK
jgi:short-subunit dehydrogenase